MTRARPLRTRILRAGALALLAVVACGDSYAPEYKLTIVGPAGVDPFAEASRVVLSMGTVRQETAVTPGRPFSLGINGIKPTRDQRGTFVLDAYATDGRLVAHGEAPPVELALVKVSGLRILVQAPATLARLGFEVPPSRDHFAVEIADKANANAGVLFGLGLSPTSMGDPAPSAYLAIWDPISVDYTRVAPLIAARRQTGVFAMSDGRALLFGGESRDAMGTPILTENAFVLRATGGGLASFALAIDVGTIKLDQPGVARHGARLASANGIYAFGGTAADTALDSAVRLDTTAAKASLLDAHMAAPRAGHTATSARPGADVLVFGGAPPGSGLPVAERFAPADPMPFVPFDAAATGPNRREHGAIALPDERRILIAGGLDDADHALDDGLVYDAQTGTFTALPALLSSPRHGFCLTRVDGDLVVAGGLGGSGETLATADVIDATTLQRVATVPALPRSGAACAPLPNHGALFIGGEDSNGDPTGAIEVYQPRR